MCNVWHMQQLHLSKLTFQFDLQIEDNQEKFERLQMELMMENPESIPYLNAKKKMEKKVKL